MSPQVGFSGQKPESSHHKSAPRIKINYIKRINRKYDDNDSTNKESQQRQKKNYKKYPNANSIVENSNNQKEKFITWVSSKFENAQERICESEDGSTESSNLEKRKIKTLEKWATAEQSPKYQQARTKNNLN